MVGNATPEKVGSCARVWMDAAAKAPKANLAKAFATAAGGKKRGAPVKRGGAALLNAFPATKKARAGA